MQKILLISCDSIPFCHLIAQSLCDRFDRILLIGVNDFQKFIYSALGKDNPSGEPRKQLHGIGIEGAVATAAAANKAQYGAIIIDQLISKDILSNYRESFYKHGIKEINIVSVCSEDNPSRLNTETLGQVALEYSNENEHLHIADLIQDLIGRGETSYAL